MAQEISKLAVILTANSAGFAGGLKGGEQALSSFKAKADGISGSVGGIGNSLAGLAAAVGGTALVFEGIKSAFHEFIEGENALLQLDARIRSTGGAAGFTSEQLQKMAGDIQQLAAVSDDAALNAEQLLLTFTEIKGDNFKAALVAATDLSAGLGQDLQASIIQVGKALNDPAEGLTALKRVGVSFTEQQREQIRVMQEAGDVAGAQKLILQELSREFGGSATEKAKGLEGQINLATEALKDIGKEIVGVAAPALKELAGAVQNVGRFFREHTEIVQAFAKAALTGLTAVGRIAEFVFGSTGEAAKEAKAEFDGITATVPGTANAIGELSKEAQKLKDSLPATAAAMEDQILLFGLSKNQAEAYKAVIHGVTGAEVDHIQALADQLDKLEAQKKAYDELTAAAKKYVEESKTPLEKTQDEIEKIGELEQKGFLSAEQAAKAADHFASEFAKSFKFKDIDPFKGIKNFDGEKTAALERRFTNRFPAGQVDSERRKVLAIQDGIRRAAERTARNTEILVRSAGEDVSIPG